jgi:hypothetical protein
MIDYLVLADSQDFYGKLGYKNIETPWTVSKAVSDITRPKDLIPYKLEHNSKCLVGSGEQSFLYMMIKGFLTPGSYQTITPCFRDESFDTMHHKCFMKNELIVTDDVTPRSLGRVMHYALEFFRRYLPDASLDKMGDLSFDIVWKDYELGSYGIRHHDHLSWIYGTGVAEPRLSNVIKISKQQ